MANKVEGKEKDFRSKGPVGKTFHAFAWIFGTLVISLFLSIVGEWIGMTFFWEEQGSDHARGLLNNEIGYLNENFKRTFYLDRTTATMAIDISNYIQYSLYHDSGLSDMRRRLIEPVTAYEPSLMSWLKGMYNRFDDYLFAAITCVQVFCVRLFVILLSTPAFLLFGFAAMVDGLVHRDLRRYGGSIERAFVYHKAKSLLRPPVIALPALIYLALPLSVNPSYIFLPAVCLFGITIFIVATTFKKYL